MIIDEPQLLKVASLESWTSNQAQRVFTVIIISSVEKFNPQLGSVPASKLHVLTINSGISI